MPVPLSRSARQQAGLISGIDCLIGSSRTESLKARHGCVFRLPFADELDFEQPDVSAAIERRHRRTVQSRGIGDEIEQV